MTAPESDLDQNLNRNYWEYYTSNKHVLLGRTLVRKVIRYRSTMNKLTGYWQGPSLSIITFWQSLSIISYWEGLSLSIIPYWQGPYIIVYGVYYTVDLDCLAKINDRYTHLFFNFSLLSPISWPPYSFTVEFGLGLCG